MGPRLILGKSTAFYVWHASFFAQDQTDLLRDHQASMLIKQRSNKLHQPPREISRLKTFQNKVTFSIVG